MSRQRWIYPPGSSVGIPAEEYEEWKAANRHGEAAFFMPDLAPFVSPIDRSEITSRSQLREHERRHGVRQCGELSKPADYDNSARTRESFNERRFDTAFREAVNRVDGLRGD